ncbi:MAG: hypothetical protein KatS3mg105_1696 [Gemmatales bacterium]|nr:MAG: hypothetical protein KatS3mg105_1696 [Gemmatales bacterium]
MSIVVPCPACTRQLRIPEEHIGRDVRCPKCSHVFHAEEDNSSSDQVADSLDHDTAGSSASLHDDLEYCPNCGRSVELHDTQCPYCGEPLEEAADAPQEAADSRPPWEREGGFRRDCEPHRGPLILTLGILSIVIGFLGVCTMGIGGVVGAIIGIVGWILGQTDLKKIRHNRMDPLGHGSTHAGWVCAIIGTVISVLTSLMCVGVLVLAVANRSARPPVRPVRPVPKRLQISAVPEGFNQSVFER